MFLPADPPRGGRWSDHQMVINGIFFRARAGCPWRDLPEGFGGMSSARRARAVPAAEHHGLTGLFGKPMAGQRRASSPALMVQLAASASMRQAAITYRLTFEPTAPGSRMQWPGQVQPKGAFRLLGSLITWMGTRQEQRIWTSLKDRLEARRHRHQPAGSASHLTWLPGSSSLSRE